MIRKTNVYTPRGRMVKTSSLPRFRLLLSLLAITAAIPAVVGCQTVENWKLSRMNAQEQMQYKYQRDHARAQKHFDKQQNFMTATKSSSMKD